MMAGGRVDRQLVSGWGLLYFVKCRGLLEGKLVGRPTDGEGEWG